MAGRCRHDSHLEAAPRWIIDQLTDARHSEAERISIAAYHPFWKAYEQTDADRQREAEAVAAAWRNGTVRFHVYRDEVSELKRDWAASGIKGDRA